MLQWVIKELPLCDPAQDLLAQQPFLLLDLDQDALVLSGAPGEVWQHLVNRAVWHVFVH